jgi:cobalt/nickel transport system permease protein
MVSVFYWGISIIVLSIALRKTTRYLGERQVPLMGVLAAAIFAAQLLNFPIAGGTSGHLLGAALAAILLGPWPAMLVMACVIGTQALIFQDGGLLAMGANIFNIGIVSVLVAYPVYALFNRLGGGKRWGILAGGFAAGWFSVFFSALSCALQLAFSGTLSAAIAVPVMASVHALIGVGEGLVTLGALSYIYNSRKETLQPQGNLQVIDRGLLAGGTVTALVFAVLSPLASSKPDGLEAVAHRFGFAGMEYTPGFSLIPGYLMPGIQNHGLAAILAALLGTGLFLTIVWTFVFRHRKITLKD